MKMFKKLRYKIKKIKANVYIFDETSERKIIYNFQLPKNFHIKSNNSNNTIKIHKNLICRNVQIIITKSTIGSSCVLEDSESCRGLDLTVYFLQGENSELKIGKNTEMNGTKIWLGNGSKCYIGDNCLFSYNINIRTTDGHTIIDKKTNKIINNQKRPCIISDNCWIGLNSIINKNAQLAEYTIVGSGSVLTKRFIEPNIIVAGNPCKIIRKDIIFNKKTISEYENDNIG